MSTAQAFPVLDNITSVAVWSVGIFAVCLFLMVGVTLGTLLGALLLALVVFASTAIATVLIGMSLVKIVVSAIQSYLRVQTAKAAYKAARIVR
jgi:antibiotic biosynthesis monooxygenase (ABM) superfamily enzyme